MFIKGTASLNSSDPPCKDDNARFTTVPLKALSDQVYRIRYQCLKFQKLIILIVDFLQK